ncbi:hypothetical protein EGY09_15350 [Stenotrophomonas maltophilia]|nr:hypothetical protein EGY09_15350 [Stenotrophomonas maltophilia]
MESVDTSVGSCHKIGPFPSAGVRSEVHACVYADRLRLGLDDGNPIAAELLANARLIAAAPELLEALERIALPHDCGCVPCTGQCRSQIALEIAVEEMQGLARAAIAKATGGAQ